MNKYTKNIIFFNLEKIIALTTLLTIVILTISLLSSCTSTKYTYHKNYPCPTFKNSRI
jgi:hypothetical protein